MASYTYEAVNALGARMAGTLDVTDQAEALRRVREMGLFPTKLAEARRVAHSRTVRSRRFSWSALGQVTFPGTGSRLRPRALTVFTRQLATLLDAGMPLLRGLRTLEEQAESVVLKRIIREIGASIESGSSFSEALAAHPKVFNGLYCNMARAGELAGVLETTLRRLAEFMEKAEQIKGKVKSAMFYPVAVLFIAAGIMVVLMAYVVPKFQSVFEGLLNGVEMPRFTMLIVSLSDFLRSHAMEAGIGVVGLGTLLTLGLKTRWGRRVFDGLKLRMPVVGPVFRKLAISRFSRTLGTLLNSGVPVLQALTIVRDTTGNVVVSDVVSRIHDRVKQGETISAPLRASRVFPAMVAGMVDVGEQTGALPDMLMKIADGYDDEVDNAVAAMTRLLEPILIVLLAVVVGSIVFAMFLPLLVVMEDGFGGHEMPD